VPGPSECIWSPHCLMGILTLVIYTAFICCKEQQNGIFLRNASEITFLLSSELGFPETSVWVFYLPFMNEFGECSLLRRHYVYVRFFEVFVTVWNTTLFCFLISIQFSRVNDEGMLISGVKEIQISTRKWDTMHPVSWSAAVISQPHFDFVLWGSVNWNSWMWW
jgi:hypothetical protein